MQNASNLFNQNDKRIEDPLQKGKIFCIHDASPNLISFNTSESIGFHGRAKPDKLVLMRLLYSNCVPILTYGCAVKDYSTMDMLRCHVALIINNNAIWKIVSFATWQSIRHMSYGFKSIYELFETAKCKFRNAASNSSNSVILLLSSLAVP